MRDLPILLELAQAGAHVAPCRMSSKALAAKLGVSQQTAARWLIDLERRGLITRTLDRRGQNVQLTKEGQAALRSAHQRLSSIFDARPRTLELKGSVTSGLGEGGYYMRQEDYREQFRRLLGFEPYPGTLDIKLSNESRELKAALENLPGKRVDGFVTPERTFGQVKCFPAKLRGVQVAVVMPLRSSHADVIELIAAKNLRKSLRLKDGDAVKVEVTI